MEDKFLPVDLLFHGSSPSFPMDHCYCVRGPDGGSGEAVAEPGIPEPLRDQRPFLLGRRGVTARLMAALGKDHFNGKQEVSPDFGRRAEHRKTHSASTFLAFLSLFFLVPRIWQLI